MRPDLRFRLFHHLTLALAGTCLLYAEGDFLPEVQVGLLPFLALVAVAFLLRGRWVLPAWAANLLALAIVGGFGWWAFTGVRSLESWGQDVSAPAILVPYLAPGMLALVLVKLFRPCSRLDFWLVQGMGLLQVAVGCVLTTGPVFGSLLLAYVASALACLAAHHRQAEQEAAPAGGPRAPAGWPQPPPRGAPRANALAAFLHLPGGWLLPPLRWALGAGALALPPFLVTPRGDVPDWDPFLYFGARPRGSSAGQTGFSDGIDLNRTGTVEVDGAVAFTVSATDEFDAPKYDLPADLRWRGISLDHYERGVWRSGARLPLGTPLLRLPRGRVDQGPGHYVLDFTVDVRQAGGLFLADPVRPGTLPNHLPVRSLGRGRERRPPSFFYENSGTVLPMLIPKWTEYRYRQGVPRADRDRYPARRVGDSYAAGLTRQPVAGLGEWTAGLLRRLARDPRYRRYRLDLPPPPDGGPPEPGLVSTQWEAAARLLTDYLARSGEYGYSLELRRHDPDLDPVMDFLVHVKQGHCNRFASALALMLRSQGIPARVVKGSRGWEAQGDGTFAVRQSHAHAWVEALVPHAGGSEPAFDWLVLDPTPDAGEVRVNPSFSLARWWEEQQRSGEALWRELIVDYNASQQAGLWEDVSSGRLLGVAYARTAGWPLTVAALAGVGWLFWRLRPRRRGRRASGASLRGAVPFYARLLDLLARHAGLRPSPGQTAREFAECAGASLAGHPATAACAGTPARVARLFYRVRFGGVPLDADEESAVGAELAALAGALRGGAEARA